MTFTSLVDLSASQKEEFVASLATLIVGSSSEGAISAESLVAVAEKSGNKLSASYATLFGKVTEAAGGIEKFTAVPGAGGGGGGGGGAADTGAAAEAEKVEEKEEEESIDMGAGANMFGDDGDAGGGDY